MKIVISNGLFSLDPKIYDWINEQSGYQFPTDEYFQYGNKKRTKSLIDFSKSIYFSKEELRTNPYLIKAVEEFGEETNLSIIEIPDNIEWYIQLSECGEAESIHEKHRIWSSEDGINYFKDELKEPLRIAINTKIGGFHITEEMYDWIATQTDALPSDDEILQELITDGFFNTPGINKSDEFLEFCVAQEKENYWYYIDHRSDELLLEAIDKFKPQHLKIVEIPNDIDWELIETETGPEYIAEAGRREWY